MNKTLLRIRSRNEGIKSYSIVNDEVNVGFKDHSIVGNTGDFVVDTDSSHEEESDMNDEDVEVKGNADDDRRSPAYADEVSTKVDDDVKGNTSDDTVDVLLHIGNDDIPLNDHIIEYEDINFFVDFEGYIEARRNSRGKNKVHVLQYVHIGKSNRYPLYTATTRCELYVTTSRRYKHKLQPIRRHDGTLHYMLTYDRMNASVPAGLLFAVIFINGGRYEEDRIVEFIDGDDMNYSPQNLEYIKKKTLDNEPMITPYNMDTMIRKFIRSAFVKYAEGREFINAPDAMIPYFHDVIYKNRILNYIIKSPVFNDSLRERFVKTFYSHYLC